MVRYLCSNVNFFFAINVLENRMCGRHFFVTKNREKGERIWIETKQRKINRAEGRVRRVKSAWKMGAFLMNTGDKYMDCRRNPWWFTFPGMESSPFSHETREIIALSALDGVDQKLHSIEIISHALSVNVCGLKRGNCPLFRTCSLWNKVTGPHGLFNSTLKLALRSPSFPHDQSHQDLRPSFRESSENIRTFRERRLAD